MKITKIKLCNLASLEGEIEVDFELEPLKSSGIFAISGPTGSGKSTILDALCLALYDKTPRFQSTENAKITDGEGDSINQNDVRNILRRGTSSGYAEVEFIAVDGNRYRSNWSVRRAHNSPLGKLQPQKISVYNLDDHLKELQGGKTEILLELERLVGLKYAQFTRTVLLAQNDFATFLKSRQSDKAELLEKLTGTEVYSEISKQIYLRAKLEGENVDRLSAQIEVVKLLSPEELSILTAQFNELTLKEKEAGKRLDSYKKLAEAFKRKQYIEKDIKQSELDLKQNREFCNRAKEDLEKHHKVTLDFEDKCLLVQKEIEEALELDGQLKTREVQQTALYNKLKQLQEVTLSKYKELQQRELTVEKALSKLKTIYSKLEIPESHKTDFGTIITYLEAKLKSLSLQQEQLNNAIKQVNVEELSKVQEKLKEEREQINNLKSAFVIYQQQVILLSQQEKELLSIKSRVDPNEKQLLILKESLKMEQTLSRELEKMLREVQIQTSSNVKKLRDNLQDGTACPVCGSTQHNFEHIQSESELSVLEKSLENKTAQINGINTNITALTKEIEHNALDIVKLEKSINELKLQITAIVSKYTLDCLNNEYLTNQLSELKLQEEEIAKQNKYYRELTDSYAKIIEQKDVLQRHKDLLSSNYKLYTDEKIAKEYSTKEWQELAKQQEEIAKEFQIDKQGYERLLSKRKALLKGKSVTDSKVAIDAHRKKLADILNELDDKRQVFPNKISSLNGRIGQLKEQLTILLEELKEVDEDSNNTLLVELQKQLEEDKIVLSEISVALKQHTINEEQSKTLLKEKQRVSKVAEQWSKLSQLFGSADGAKFKIIAQSYTLHILLLHANKHLSYLAKRYRLEQVDGTLSLQVVDRDMCDEIRTVYSLSGGESFLISLALALGLSSLSSNNLKVESLFIDEGFGSLDAESLRTAMDALEQLQIQGRKIGVISHVQEMSERIPTQIYLTKENSGKSSLSIIG